MLAAWHAPLNILFVSTCRNSPSNRETMKYDSNLTCVEKDFEQLSVQTTWLESCMNLNLRF